MPLGIPQLALFLVGLALVFFGLPLFRGALTFFGFVVGAAYGIFLFTLFSQQTTLDPILKLAFGAAIGLVGGLVGAGLANFAQVIFVFLAGGLVALLIAKLVQGVPVDQARNLVGWDQLVALLHPQVLDFVWFLVGGIVFVMAMDTIMIIALVALGSALIYRGLHPLHLMQPEWLIPAIIGILGFFAQESLRNRAMAHRKVVVVEQRVHHMDGRG